MRGEQGFASAARTAPDRFSTSAPPRRLGAEITGFDFGTRFGTNASRRPRRLPRVAGARLFGPRGAASRSGRVRPPLRRGPGPRHEPVPRGRLSRALPPLSLDADGRPSGRHPTAGPGWHTDGSWQARTGLATMMYAVEIPARGGETHFCDMYGALERLGPETRRRIEDLRAIHNLDFSRTRRHGEEPMTEAQRRQVPPVAHPIVRTHPETGRDCLFLGDHAETVEGMDHAEGRAWWTRSTRPRRASAPSIGTGGARGSSWCGTTAA